MCSAHVNISSSNNEENGNNSDCSDLNPVSVECYKFLKNQTDDDFDLVYHRFQYDTSKSYSDSDDEDLQSSLDKSRSIRNKSLKNFLFLFGFASSLIILSQLYLSLYYDDPISKATVSGWDRNRTREIPLYVLPNINTTLIEPMTLCKKPDPVLLLIIVCSSANNFRTRQILRETWANTTEFNYSKFAAIHWDFKGKYLDINYPEWKNFRAFPKVDSKNNRTVSEYDRPNDEGTMKLRNQFNQFDFRVRAVFLVGQTGDNETQAKIVDESRLHDDVIQESFLDSYNNLTLKTIMMLKWVTSNCIGKVKFLMKCDDDAFVNIPNLIHFLLGGTIPVYNATFPVFDDQTLRTLASRNRLHKYNNLLIGSRFCHSKPISNTSSKWFAPAYMYDRKIYPNYLSGAGYLMTLDAAVKLYSASMLTPLLHLEDVYLTGICAEKAQIEPTHHHLFNYLSYKDLCEFRGMITIHEIRPSDMKKAYKFILNSNATCTAPGKYSKSRKAKNSYKYCK